MSRRVSESGANKREMNPIKRYYVKSTRKAAINAMCAYCMGCMSTEQGNGSQDHLEPGFRTEIRNCSAPACPLFDYRPYQANKTTSNVCRGGTG